MCLIIKIGLLIIYFVTIKVKSQRLLTEISLQSNTLFFQHIFHITNYLHVYLFLRIILFRTLQSIIAVHM